LKLKMTQICEILLLSLKQVKGYFIKTVFVILSQAKTKRLCHD